MNVMNVMDIEVFFCFLFYSALYSAVILNHHAGHHYFLACTCLLFDIRKCFIVREEKRSPCLQRIQYICFLIWCVNSGTKHCIFLKVGEVDFKMIFVFGNSQSEDRAFYIFLSYEFFYCHSLVRKWFLYNVLKLKNLYLKHTHT